MSTDVSMSPTDEKQAKSLRKSRQAGAIIREFGLNTSTHGIPGIARSESMHNRIFWSISLLIFTSIMTYFIVQSIRAYFQYPTQTSVSIVTQWPQPFPAVTVCNYSPLRYDRVMEPFLSYAAALNLTNTTDTANFTRAYVPYMNQFLIDKLNRNESINEYLYSLESMMMFCSFNGLSCTVANFTWFLSSLYGLCYTFNANPKDSLNKHIRNSGENGGVGTLELHLYIHQHQYVPYMTSGVGAAVVVHDNAQAPIVELKCTLLGPGRHHRLGYGMKTSTFLPLPYTSCNDQINAGMQAVYTQYHDTDYEYSQKICYTACIQAYVYHQCGCGSPFYRTTNFVVLPGSDKSIHIPFCNISDPCYTQATAEIMTTQSIWTFYCPDCGQECTFNDILISSTSVYSPPAYLMNEIKTFVESTDVPLPMNWSTTWPSEILLSYVSLEVTLELTRSEIYSQQASIGPVDVISNVGGQTGLWIGISFLSLMEIAEMIYRLLRSQYHRFR